MRLIARRAGGLVAAAGLTAAALTGCTSSAGAAWHLHVTPARALFDVPVAVSVTGAPAGSRVTLATSSKAQGGTTWTAKAMFTASRAGTVDTGQAPNAGSYRGVNPMGLFEDAAPGGVASEQRTFIPPTHYTITVTATVAGRHRSTTITRLLPSQDGVTSTDLRPATSSGLYGEFYRPRSTATRRPAVVVIGGSEGGLSTTLSAGELAAHGYPALALAYFREPGLPAELDRIPIEYFAKAFDYLARQPGVDPQRMTIWGTSRGSEAALLTGAHYPKLVAGVVASVPSDIAYPGLTRHGGPAWTFGGKAVPTETGNFYSAVPDNKAALIPITAIRGPIFAVCAGNDLVWPSCDHLSSIQRRLTAAHSTHRPTLLRYPGAGHYVGDLVPYLPSTNLVRAGGQTTGGTASANEAGRADAFPKLLHWLATLPALR